MLSPYLQDTAKAAAVLDTTPPPSLEAKKIKCQEVEKSAFRTHGCCADICTSEKLELKEPDCCCNEVLNTYEQMYKDNALKKGGMEDIAKVKNDFIFSKCKKKYRQKVQEIEKRYKPKGADSSTVSKSKFD